MKIEIKAALLSALVCPGAGYFVSRCYYRAASCIALVAVCLGLLIYEAYQQALTVLDNIVQQGVMDVAAISQQMEQAPAVLPAWLSQWLPVVLFALWVFSTIDSYRMAGKFAARHATP